MYDAAKRRKKANTTVGGIGLFTFHFFGLSCDNYSHCGFAEAYDGRDSRRRTKVKQKFAFSASRALKDEGCMVMRLLLVENMRHENISSNFGTQKCQKTSSITKLVVYSTC